MGDTGRVFGVAALLALVSGCALTARSDADHPYPEGTSVLLSSENAEKLAALYDPPILVESSWIPSESQLRKVEARLPSVIQAALDSLHPEATARTLDPLDYYRQYAGVIRNGKQKILVAGLQKEGIVLFTDPVTHQETWRDEIFEISDAGPMVFRVEYDVQNDRFSPVEFNGP